MKGTSSGPPHHGEVRDHVTPHPFRGLRILFYIHGPETTKTRATAPAPCLPAPPASHPHPRPRPSPCLPPPQRAFAPIWRPFPPLLPPPLPLLLLLPMTAAATTFSPATALPPPPPPSLPTTPREPSPWSTSLLSQHSRLRHLLRGLSSCRSRLLLL